MNTNATDTIKAVAKKLQSVIDEHDSRIYATRERIGDTNANEKASRLGLRLNIEAERIAHYERARETAEALLKDLNLDNKDLTDTQRVAALMGYQLLTLTNDLDHRREGLAGEADRYALGEIFNSGRHGIKWHLTAWLNGLANNVE